MTRCMNTGIPNGEAVPLKIGADSGSKLTKAEELGVPVIDEAAMLDLLK